MSGGRIALLGVAALLVIGLVVGAVKLVSYRAWYDQQPPPPQSGVTRLSASAKPSLPPIWQEVRRADGSTVMLSMYGLDQQNGRLVGHVAVRSGTQVTVLDLASGDSGSAGGVTVQAVQLWSMPDPTHSAIDVNVT